MVQQITDQSWQAEAFRLNQAEARSEETKQFIKNIKRLTRRNLGRFLPARTFRTVCFTYKSGGQRRRLSINAVRLPLCSTRP